MKTKQGFQYRHILFYTVILVSVVISVMSISGIQPVAQAKEKESSPDREFLFHDSSLITVKEHFNFSNQAAFTTCADVTDVPPAECEALVALYDSTDGDDWTDNTDWLVSDTPCSWYGVECLEGHVVALFLGMNNLNGTIPPELSNLVGLAVLKLYNNQLSGSIPGELGDLVNLYNLRLEFNKLSGSIPPELGNLGNLRILELSDNWLTGNIPPDLGNLSNLESLGLDWNYGMSGSIPPELGNLSNLGYLGLSDLGLSGNIPSALGDVVNLKYLYLDGNKLEGPIPTEIGNLVNLVNLNLARNALSGEIPNSVTNLTNLNTGWSTDFRKNMLYSTDPTVVTFLNQKDPDWDQTQTIPPEDLQVVTVTNTSVELSWTPIPYTDGGGYYEIGYATTPGGPYTSHGTTTDKSVIRYTVDGLSLNNTYYFVVRTFTPADQSWPYQLNDLLSEYSSEVSATTGITCTFSGTIDLQSRSDDSGATFTVVGSETFSTTTDAAGSYELSVPEDTYTVSAEMGRYLDGERTSENCPAGGTVQIPDVTLLGGDANDDCINNILDLAFMGARFGLSECDASFDAKADINADGSVNILDLTVAGGNFHETCPVAWP